MSSKQKIKSRCLHPVCSGLSAHAQAILSELSDGREVSAANLGLLIKNPTGMASNPGTLAATSILRSLEKRGLVRRRTDSGKTFMRTMWRLCPNVPDQATASTKPTSCDK